MTRVRVVTDSNAMIPWDLVGQLGIVVVPLTIDIGGDEIVENSELDLAAAYRRLRDGQSASTSAPSAGTFAQTYERLRGDPIVSVHIGSNFSSTLNAARLGATVADIDIHFVDTQAASFMAGCCVLAAAQAARDGAAVEAVIAAANRVAATISTVFTVAEIDRARSGGRFPGQSNDVDGVPVVRLVDGAFERLVVVHSDAEAADAMFAAVATESRRLRIGVGDADAGPIVDQLFTRLQAHRPTNDLIRYVVGPTVAAHAGMGTFGIVYHALEQA